MNPIRVTVIKTELVTEFDYVTQTNVVNVKVTLTEDPKRLACYLTLVVPASDAPFYSLGLDFDLVLKSSAVQVGEVTLVEDEPLTSI